ncbi:uncharacterized protein LOC144129613 [Amblyomma americanum]
MPEVSPVDVELPAEDSTPSKSEESNLRKLHEEGKDAQHSRSAGGKRRTGTAIATPRSPVDIESPAEDSTASKSEDSSARKHREEGKKTQPSRSVGGKRRTGAGNTTPMSSNNGESAAVDCTSSKPTRSNAERGQGDGKEPQRCLRDSKEKID